MRISTIMALAVLSILLCIAGCDQKKKPPNHGAVEYPPSSPLPSLTALPGASKMGSRPHRNHIIRGKESKWYVDGASTDDNPYLTQWILHYYYYGPPADVFKHVEECLSQGQQRYTITKSPNENRRKDRYSNRDYKFRTNDGSELCLYVHYSGHYTTPYVEYLITEFKVR